MESNMKSKILWIDCETTGLNPKKHAIIQLGALFEIDGEIEDELVLLMGPGELELDDKALQMQGKTQEEVMTHPLTQSNGIFELKKYLDIWVDRFDKKDKYVIAGYNVRFDEQFLRETFIRTGDKFFGSYFFWPVIDVAQTVAEVMILKDYVRLPDYKLETVCKVFGIDIKAHDALSDITATRELYNLLTERE